jgi:DNA-binding MarR family transcriptional regulator
MRASEPVKRMKTTRRIVTAEASTPGKPSAGCTGFGLRKLTRRVSQRYDRHLQAAGLRVTQYSLLSTLNRNDALSVTDLSHIMEMDRTTLVRNLKPLCDAGYISVSDAPSGNVRSVSLTAKGREVYKSAQPLWRKAQAEINELLGEQTVAALHELLDSSLARLKN